MSDNRSSFTNAQILSWLEYFAKKAGLDIEKIKLIDISKKQKNLIPTIETHKRVLVFADAGDPNFFFNLWDYGLGDCDIWFKTGLTPEGGVNICKLSEMIDTEITGPSVMLIFNPNSRSSYRIGMQNDNFSQGSVRYVASEIRSIIVNKLHLDDQDTICIISGESIAVESAMIASDGQIIAVEYNKHDRFSTEENINKFGLTNVTIVEDTSRRSMLRTNYLLTKSVLQMGRSLRPTNTQRIFFFEDYAEYVAIDLCINSFSALLGHDDIIYLTHPDAVKLYRYDMLHKTNLIDVLYYYCLNNGSVSQAAKAAYMHRNTFSARLAKLQELTKADLTSGEIQQRMVFSCKILRYYDRYAKINLGKRLSISLPPEGDQ